MKTDITTILKQARQKQSTEDKAPEVKGLVKSLEYLFNRKQGDTFSKAVSRLEKALDSRKIEQPDSHEGREAQGQAIKEAKQICRNLISDLGTCPLSKWANPRETKSSSSSHFFDPTLYSERSGGIVFRAVVTIEEGHQAANLRETSFCIAEGGRYDKLLSEMARRQYSKTAPLGSLESA